MAKKKGKKGNRGEKGNKRSSVKSSLKQSVHKKQAAPKTAVKPKSKSEKNVVPDEGVFLSDSLLLGLTFALAGIYFAFSFKSEGFYQQDEAAHFTNMLEFWNNPNSVLSNWSKPGFKLIYAVPALAGIEAVKLVNCLFAAFSAFFAYKIAHRAGSKVPVLAFVFLATQPFFIGLSFRNYSELISAFLLTLAVYLHYREKWLFAVLTASYIVFIRQEFYPFLLTYMGFMAYHKRFLPAAAGLIFPLIHNFWGAAKTGDYLYLVNQVLQTSSEIGDKYPRQGFEHYFVMSVTIYGGLIIAFVTAYFVLQYLAESNGVKKDSTIHPATGNADKKTEAEESKEKDIGEDAKEPVKKVFPFEKFIRKMAGFKPGGHPFIAVTAFLYFLMYCIFNIQSFPVGPATAGNLRYLIIAGPLFAVMAAMTVDLVKEVNKGSQVMYVLIPLAIVILIFLTYENNDIKLTEVRDFKPAFAFLAASVILLLPLRRKQMFLSLTGVAVLMSLLSVKPKPISIEDDHCRKLANWYKNEFEPKNPDARVFCTHTMFYYFAEETLSGMTPEAKTLTTETVEEAQPGDLIIWESHYARYHERVRPKGFKIDHFDKLKDEYRLVYENPRNKFFLIRAFVKK